MPSRSFFQVPDQLANGAIISAYDPDSLFLCQKFMARGLPPLLDSSSLARLIGISQQVIVDISIRKKDHYRSFQIEKKSGGNRTVRAPRTYLKVIQWWILDNILSRYSFGPHVTGFRPGGGPFLNAKLHHGCNHLLNVDLSDFFGTVRDVAVKEIWREFGYSDDVANQLTMLTTYGSTLPQGAPTSPALANIAAFNLDKLLQELATKMGYQYTRYADDITFSAFHRIPVDFLGTVSETVERAGFVLNTRKSRFLGRSNRMEVTGYVINERPQLSRSWRKRARAAFYSAQNNPEAYADRVNYLRGIYGAVCTFAESEDTLRKEGAAALNAVQRGNRSSAVEH